MWKIIPILLGIAGAYAGCLDSCTCLAVSQIADGCAIFNFAEVAKCFHRLSVPTILSFVNLTLTAILAMAPIAIASMMEHIGDISAISATVGRKFM